MLDVKGKSMMGNKKIYLASGSSGQRAKEAGEDWEA
jgi:hypothetical protein